MKANVKQSVYLVLRGLFEGPTILLSLGMLVYILLWFAPFMLYDVAQDVDPQGFSLLEWRPDGLTASLVTTLAIIQACFNPRGWYRGVVRVLGASVLSAFIIYTTVAPAYSLVAMTGYFPEYLPGAVTMMLMSFIVVAREVRNC